MFNILFYKHTYIYVSLLSILLLITCMSIKYFVLLLLFCNISNELLRTNFEVISDVEGNRCRGRARLGWMNGVRMALGERGMSVEQGILNLLDRRGWELIVRSEQC